MPTERAISTKQINEEYVPPAQEDILAVWWIELLLRHIQIQQSNTLNQKHIINIEGE